MFSPNLWRVVPLKQEGGFCWGRCWKKTCVRPLYQTCSEAEAQTRGSVLVLSRCSCVALPCSIKQVFAVNHLCTFGNVETTFASGLNCIIYSLNLLDDFPWIGMYILWTMVYSNITFKEAVYDCFCSITIMIFVGGFSRFFSVCNRLGGYSQIAINTQDQIYWPPSPVGNIVLFKCFQYLSVWQ